MPSGGMKTYMWRAMAPGSNKVSIFPDSNSRARNLAVNEYHVGQTSKYDIEFIKKRGKMWNELTGVDNMEVKVKMITTEDTLVKTRCFCRLFRDRQVTVFFFTCKMQFSVNPFRDVSADFLQYQQQRGRGQSAIYLVGLIRLTNKLHETYL